MKNQLIKGHLKQIAIKYDLHNLEEHQLFEIYCIHCLMRGKYLFTDLKPEDIHLQGNDEGIDGIGFSIQSQIYDDLDDIEAFLTKGKFFEVDLHLMQCTTSDSFDSGKMNQFITCSADFLQFNNTKPTDQLNEKTSMLKTLIESGKISKGLKVHLHYFFTGQLNRDTNVKERIEKWKAQIENIDISANVTIEIHDFKLLTNYYSQALNTNETKFNYSSYINLPNHDSVEEAFLGYVSGDELVKLISIDDKNTNIVKINSSVFYDNIRDELESSDINSSIRNDLKNGQTNDFIFKNNGVTIVARDFKRNSSQFTIQDYQVVNGCQTSTILFKAKYEDELDLASVKIPLRLIVTQDQDFVSSIITGTNKQNPVSKEQLIAFKPFIKTLEQFSSNCEAHSRLYFERRTNQYTRDESIELSKVYSIGTLIKSICSLYYGKPHLQSRYKTDFYKDHEEELFAEDHLVDAYHYCALTYVKLYDLTKKKNGSFDKIYLHYVLFAINQNLGLNSEILLRSQRSNTALLTKIKELALNKAELTNFYSRTTSILNELFKQTDGKREQLRDFLRAPKTAADFSKKLKELNKMSYTNSN